MGSQCSPVDFSRDLEEGKKALSVFTGCSSAAEGVTWEKHVVADGTWHGWQDNSVSLQWKIQLMVGWSRARRTGCRRHRHFTGSVREKVTGWVRLAHTIL